MKKILVQLEYSVRSNIVTKTKTHREFTIVVNDIIFLAFNFFFFFLALDAKFYDQFIKIC